MSREDRDIYSDYDLLLFRSGVREKLERLPPYILANIMKAIEQSFGLLSQRKLLGSNKVPQLSDLTNVAIMCFEQDETATAKVLAVDISELGVLTDEHGHIGDPAKLQISIIVSYAWPPIKGTRLETKFGNDLVFFAAVEDMFKDNQAERPVLAEEVPSVVLDIVPDDTPMGIRGWIRWFLKGK